MRETSGCAFCKNGPAIYLSPSGYGFCRNHPGKEAWNRLSKDYAALVEEAWKILFTEEE